MAEEMADEYAEVSIKEDAGSITIIGGGMMDLSNTKDFEDGLKRASETVDDITVDLRKAQFIDTAVIQYMARAAVALMKRGARLKVLTTETEYPLRALRVSGLEGIMDIAVELEGA